MAAKKKKKATAKAGRRPGGGRLRQQKQERLRRFLELLDSYEPSDAQGFSDLLAEADSFREVRRDGIAEAFGVTLATVSRWVNGINTPQLYLREGVISHVRDVLVKAAGVENSGETPGETVLDTENWPGSQELHESLRT